MNSFVARLLGQGIGDFTTFAIWELRSFLEHHRDQTTANLQKLSWDMATASEWIVRGGSVLYARALALESEPGFDQATRGGPLYGESKSGLTIERWAFWKKGFLSLLREKGGVPVDMQEAAIEAWQTMERIDKKGDKFHR